MIKLSNFEALVCSLCQNPGAYAVLLGSGLSRSANIPTGWEITLELIRRVSSLREENTPDNLPEWYKNTFGKDADYSDLLDMVAGSEAERRQIIHQFIESQDDEDQRRPTLAHYAVAQLVSDGIIKVIITTNFDRLMETALKERGIEPTIISHESDIRGAEPLVHARCTVIKVHGDYLDTRIKNTPKELATYSDAMNTLLDRIFDWYGLLVVGWSGEWDVALRDAILRAPGRRYQLYWAARGKPSSQAQSLIDNRRGKVIEITDADSFVTKLLDSIKGLRESMEPHPDSLEIKIALSKKYCRDDYYNLEWTELLQGEIREIIDHVEKNLRTDVNDKATFNEAVRFLVEVSHGIRILSFICARWGTDDSFRILLNEMEGLSFKNKPIGGYAYYINILNAPFSLCFYCSILGAYLSEKYVRVFQCFDHEIHLFNSKNPSKYILQAPFPCYEHIEWKLLDGLERNKIPQSAFIANTISVDSKYIVLSENMCKSSINDIEKIITIHYASERIDEQKKVPDLLFWAPYGDYIFDSFRMPEEIFGSFLNSHRGRALISTGLANGKAQDAVDTLVDFAKHRNWG